ncbi:Ig-like domain-containing protein [Plantactinospora sp. CA-290183]|uniref:Ig-like domain-containing protein n=1 Tax=Plantactinospora sp. CA-290183 TaxID=3240006 RepID=UPI003D8F9055
MWSRRSTTLTILTTAALLAAAPPATAGAPGDPIMGDFNLDGIQDRAVLGAVEPDLCSVIVQYGAGPGVYVPPVAHVYTRPGGHTGIVCPDIGTAFDADGDHADELWVGWSAGPPPGVAYNRLAIDHDFDTITTYTSPIVAPAFVGRQDFAGTGVLTPFTVGPGGYATALMQDTTPVAGPQQWCSANTPGFQHIDFDGDRAMDTLLTYSGACADNSSGVVVLLDDGTARQLELDPTGTRRWRVAVVYSSPDRIPDVRTTDIATGEVEIYHGTGFGTFVRGPDANTDRVYLTRVRPIAINVLANDWAAADTDVVVTVPPRYGTVQVLSDRRILYRPNPQHGRTDRFTYQLVRDDRRSSATVYLTFPPETTAESPTTGTSLGIQQATTRMTDPASYAEHDGTHTLQRIQRDPNEQSATEPQMMGWLPGPRSFAAYDNSETSIWRERRCPTCRQRSVGLRLTHRADGSQLWQTLPCHHQIATEQAARW